MTATASAPPSSAQLTSTPLSALYGTVSSTRLAYTQRQRATQQVERDIPFAVAFYLRERPGETRSIPDCMLLFSSQ
jgi:hypothetical protein